MSRCSKRLSFEESSPRVGLDNLEAVQLRWANLYRNTCSPPEPCPQLNSPRSLAACQNANVKLEDLQYFSPRQLLLSIVGDPTATTDFSAQGDSSTRDSINRFFHEHAVGMGTFGEKMLAYQRYQAQETRRLSALARVQAAALRESRKSSGSLHPSPVESPDRALSDESSPKSMERRSVRILASHESGPCTASLPQPSTCVENHYSKQVSSGKELYFPFERKKPTTDTTHDIEQYSAIHPNNDCPNAFSSYASFSSCTIPEPLQKRNSTESGGRPSVPPLSLYEVPDHIRRVVRDIAKERSASWSVLRNGTGQETQSIGMRQTTSSSIPVTRTSGSASLSPSQEMNRESSGKVPEEAPHVDQIQIAAPNLVTWNSTTLREKSASEFFASLGTEEPNLLVQGSLRKSPMQPNDQRLCTEGRLRTSQEIGGKKIDVHLAKASSPVRSQSYSNPAENLPDTAVAGILYHGEKGVEPLFSQPHCDIPRKPTPSSFHDFHSKSSNVEDKNEKLVGLHECSKERKDLLLSSLPATQEPRESCGSPCGERKESSPDSSAVHFNVLSTSVRNSLSQLHEGSSSQNMSKGVGNTDEQNTVTAAERDHKNGIVLAPLCSSLENAVALCGADSSIRGGSISIINEFRAKESKAESMDSTSISFNAKLSKESLLRASPATSSSRKTNSVDPSALSKEETTSKTNLECLDEMREGNCSEVVIKQFADQSHCSKNAANVTASHSHAIQSGSAIEDQNSSDASRIEKDPKVLGSSFLHTSNPSTSISFFCPPQLTADEEMNGFYYYCANAS